MQLPSFRTIATVCLLSAVVMSVTPVWAGIPEVISARALVDLSETIQKLSADNARVDLKLTDAVKDKKDRLRDLELTLVVLDGKWQESTVDTSQGKFRIDASGLKASEKKLTGTLNLVSDKETLTYELDGTVRTGGRAKPTDIDIRSARFWRLYPEAQGPAWTVSGAHTHDGKKNKLAGRFQLPVRKGKWNMGTPTAKDAVAMTFDMGDKRQNWNHAAMATLELPKPMDLSKYDGIRLSVSTDKLRDDASVSIWLREADGSWYYVKAAVPLVDAKNQRTVLFEDFDEAEWISPTSHMDEDYVMDIRGISHLAIGIANPLGIGEVSFTLDGLDLVKCRPAEQKPVQAKVTGRTLAVNGQEFVPPGIFGGYAPDLPQEYRPGCQRNLRFGLGGGPKIPGKDDHELFHIDCMGDRYQTALLLTDSNWKKTLRRIGSSYAKKAAEADYTAHLEFWNEPYLNWARGAGAKNYQLNLYDVSKAKEGGPVVAKKTGIEIPHFRWRKINGKWRVEDETQYTYFSGKGNGWIYDQMCKEIGRAVKETNPDVQFIAGWGFRWHEGRWAAWDMLYKPTIDRNIEYIDGICEHHYQGDTTAMNGAYEMLVAYGHTKHNKKLWCYNTETGDLVDAPARGKVDTPAKAKAATYYRKMTYNLRDCLYSVLQSPDKLRARTVIHAAGKGKGNPYTQVAFGMMKNLRGRLVETQTDDRDVWCVSSIDGTDKRAMPDDGGKTLVVFLFNNHRESRKVNLQVQAPEGTSFDGGAIEIAAVDKSNFDIALERKKIDAAGKSAEFSVTLPDRGGWKVEFPLKGTPADKAQVVRTQHFSADLLKQVRRGKPFKTVVKMDADAIKQADAARLRLVLENLSPEEGVVLVNGTEISLPKAYTADNNNEIIQLPLEVKTLTPETKIEFRVNDGNFRGYQVDVTSIVLEMRQ